MHRGKAEFERAALVDPLPETQHPSPFSEDAGQGEQLHALRASLTTTTPEPAAQSASNPRLAETRHIAVPA